jgi:protein-tyrosine-phosphatase
LFVSYQVLADPDARSIIRDLAAEDWIEIGCHVHPWNTPPYDAALPPSTMLYNLPYESQRAKIATVVEAIDKTTGRRPKTFRAGRFGFGATTAQALIDEGFTCDSSVTPLWDWRRSSDGPDFGDAPMGVYRIRPDAGVLRHEPEGDLVEVPLTAGFTGLNAAAWPQLDRLLRRPLVRSTHLGGALSVGLNLGRAIMSPEGHTAKQMFAIARRVLDSGGEHVHMFFHSSSLLPGLTPFAKSRREVERLFGRVEQTLTLLHDHGPINFATVGEVAEGLGGVVSPSVSDAPVRAAPTPSPIRVTSSVPIRRSLRPGDFGGVQPMIGVMARRLLWRVGVYRGLRQVRWAEVARLVFVCRGNICRSAYGDFYAQHLGLPAASIGTQAILGRQAHPRAIEIAAERGLDLGTHRTLPFDSFEPQDGDLFLAMEPYQCRDVAKAKWAVAHQVSLLGLWHETNGPVIVDPYGRERQAFRSSFDLIEACIDDLRRRVALGDDVKPLGSGLPDPEYSES